MKIGIVSYSSSNTTNVKRLFEKVFNQKLIEIQDLSIKPDILVLPGVGNFQFVKNELDKKGLTKLIIESNFEKIFGICLGMHLLQKDSRESLKGPIKGLNFGDKSVVSIASNSIQKRVHTGWNYVKFIDERMVFLSGYYYFSHSFGILWTGKKDELAFYEINEKKFVAVSNLNNKIGVQFHPELSGRKGRELIKILLG